MNEERLFAENATVANTGALEILPEVIEEVLKKIDQFERENQYLDNTVTLHNMAKYIGTNSSYLSKIINSYKHKNFSTFLTDLRINYVINALKEDPKLREYTIEAIAFEVGFKNVQSFRAAFHKRTKLQPSYFVNQLNAHSEYA